MKKRLFSVMLGLLAPIIVFTSSAQANEGIKSGLFTYTMKGNGTAVITAFDSQFNRNKDVYVPSQIDGYTVSEIGNSSFANAESKSVIVLPDTLTTIGTSAFSWSKFTSISIPSGVKQIGARAFSKMENVEKFSVDKNNAVYATIDGVLYNKISKELVAYPGGSEYSIPEGILSIGDSAFQSYRNGVQNEPLKVILPNTLRCIGCRAFEELELGNLIIPSSVEEIGEGAFRNANVFSLIDGEQRLYLPSGVKAIGVSAFSQCGRNADYKYIDLMDSQLTVIPDSAFCLVSSQNIKAIYLPASLINIGKNAFEGVNVGMQGITFPDALVSIESGAFRGGKGNISFAENSSLKTIEKRAFKDFVFEGMNGSLALPEGLETIGEEAFWEIKGIETIYVPESVTSIGENFCNRAEVILEVESGSYAEYWASENGYLTNLGTNEDTSWLNS